jgi:hypothetical protein
MASPATAPTLARNLREEYAAAEKALALRAASLLRPLAGPGASIRLTAHIVGPKISIKLDPEPHALVVEEERAPMRRTP